MRKQLVLLLVAIATPTLLVAQGQSTFAVEGEDFVADYFAPQVEGNYGVIVLTGSAGGKATEFTKRIVAMGQPVLSLSYFYDVGLPNALEMIPMEYFDAPKQWLIEREETSDDGVILIGLSKGAELALVLAAEDSDYKGVIALAPSSVVWAGIPEDTSTITSAPSSWSREGKPMEFVPYISRDGLRMAGLGNLLHWHTAALADANAVEAALIEVEKISSPVLLFSGGADSVWPAAAMATSICDRINGTNRVDSCQHITYDNGDHLLDNEIPGVDKEIASFLDALAQ